MLLERFFGRFSAFYFSFGPINCNSSHNAFVKELMESLLKSLLDYGKNCINILLTHHIGHRGYGERLMGFIGKLLSGVSSAVLLLVGASGSSASPSYQGADPEQQHPGIFGGAGELLAGFIADTGARYTEDSVDAAVRRMFDGISPDRVEKLPEFVRALRSLRLSPEVEVAAIETVVSTLEELPESLISPEQVAAA